MRMQRVTGDIQKGIDRLTKSLHTLSNLLEKAKAKNMDIDTALLSIAIARITAQIEYAEHFKMFLEDRGDL